MGMKLLWVGLTFLVAVTVLDSGRGFQDAGAVIMVIGCILMVIDK